ncbi:MAG: hypothetical protein IPG89_20625 [Bacteroidetes bacterium]|nr:hypothetical protein [Bacteroidota bacterium]
MADRLVKKYHYTPNGDIERRNYKRKKVKVTYDYPPRSAEKRNDKLILLDTLYRFYFTGEWKCYTIKRG